MPLPDPETEPTMALWPDVGRDVLGLSRNTTYSEAKRYEVTDGREGIPVIRFASRYRCPTAAIRRLVGLDQDKLEDQGPALRVVGGDR